MKWGRIAAVLVAMTLTAAACGDDSGGSSSDDWRRPAAAAAAAANLKANTGEVNLLSAGEPEEAAAYQKIFDDMINAEADYKATVEPSADFEEQFQIRADGGTLDVAAVPQPGAIPGLVDKGRPRLARGPRVQHRRPQQAVRCGVRRPRRVQGQALRPADEHQPEEHGLVPEEGVRRRGLHGAEDVGRAARAQRQDRRRRQHAVVRRLRERRRDRLARDRLDGRHHAPHGWHRHLRQVGDARDPVQRPGRADRPARCSATSCSHDGYVLGGAAATADVAFGDAPAADVRQPAEVLAPPPGELHQRASSPRAPSRASTTTGSRFPRSTRTAPCSAVS